MLDEQLIVEFWDLFKEYVPSKNLEIAANHFVDFLVDHDVSTETLEGLMGMDTHLDDAIKSLLREESGYDDDNEDEEYYEDEDY